MSWQTIKILKVEISSLTRKFSVEYFFLSNFFQLTDIQMQSGSLESDHNLENIDKACNNVFKKYLCVLIYQTLHKPESSESELNWKL